VTRTGNLTESYGAQVPPRPISGMDHLLHAAGAGGSPASAGGPKPAGNSADTKYSDAGSLTAWRALTDVNPVPDSAGSVEVRHQVSANSLNGCEVAVSARCLT